MENLNKLSKKLQDELAFTETDLLELEKARSMPITFDKDSPETTPERAIKFKRVNPKRKNNVPSPA